MDAITADRSDANAPLTGGGEPIDLDEYIQRRTRVLETWEAWDESQSHGRSVAFCEACVAYAGESHVAFGKFIAAVRRGGGDRVSALNAWESDW